MMQGRFDSGNRAIEYWRRMNVGSLFSGIGGMDKGLEDAGMTVRWQVENDRYCSRVLAHHWPDVTRYGDIKDVDTAGLEPVDLICGGFPCQPFSTAGRRRGTADDRWLWPEYLRIVRGVKPRWVLVENVPGLLSISNGRVFAGILRDLAESGYDAEWDMLPATAFGAPHLRYRLFIVAHAQHVRRPSGAVHVTNIPQTLLRGQTDTPKPSGEALAHAAHVGRQRSGETRNRGNRPENGSPAVSYADSTGRAEQRRPFSIFAEHPAIERSGWWETEPNVGRVVDGFPSRVAQLTGLGNAVVPQVAEWIGRRILEVDNGQE